MKHFSFVIISLVSLVLLFSGCASSNKDIQAPEAALHEWLDAIYNHRAGIVYQYLPDDMQAKFTRSEFEDYFEANYPLILEQARHIESMTSGVTPTITAVATDDPCRNLVLIREADGWHFSDVPTYNSIKPINSRIMQRELEDYLNSDSFRIALQTWIDHHAEAQSVRAKDIMRFLTRSHLTWGVIEWKSPYFIIHINDTSSLSFVCQEGGWQFSGLQSETQK